MGYIDAAKRKDWGTPQALFDKLNLEFKFTLDVCATAENAKCKVYFTEKDDALKQDWGKNICWMNPPYGREILKWMHKAYWSMRRGATVVCLLPARTDTRWFHNFALSNEIRYIQGRLNFEGTEHNAPFASLIVIFRPKTVDDWGTTYGHTSYHAPKS